MFAHPYIDICYAAPTHPLIRQILYPKVAEMLEELGVGYKINRSEGTIKINGMGTIITKTLDNPDLLVGFEVGAVFIDELDLLTYDKAEASFMKLSARIRQKFKPILPTPENPDPQQQTNQIFISTTPEGFKWIYHKFVKDPIPNSRLIRMSTYSNRQNLPDGYIESLEEKFGNSPMLEAYLNGEFVSMEGHRVLPSYNRFDCHSDRQLSQRDRIIYISCDFNVTKMEAVIYVKDYSPNSNPYNYTFVAVDEINTVYDTPELIQIVKERYGDKEVIWFPDASSASRKTVDASKSDLSQLREVGIVKAHSKNPLIKDRVAASDVAFKKGYVKINHIKCPNTAESLEQMTYDTNGKPDKTLPCEHKFDAATYLIAYEFPVHSSKLSTSSIRSW